MSNNSAVGAQHHITPISVYAKNVTALIVLMVLTVVASQIVLPGGTLVNNIVAMTIAVIKAALIMTFFMGLKYSSPLTRIFGLGAFFFLGLLYGILLDYGTRGPDAIAGFHGDAGSALRMGAARQMAPTPGDHALDIKPGKPGDE